MKTKFEVGDKVLVETEIQQIKIDRSGVYYHLLIDGDDGCATLNFREDRVKQG